MAQYQADVSGEALLNQSFQKVEPRLLALQPQQFVQVNIDVVGGAMTAIGAYPEIMKLRDRVEKEAPGASVENFDWLLDYARTVLYCQTEYVTACRPPDDLQALLSEGTDLRTDLHADATTLVERDLINGEALREYKGLNGYRNVAVDLQILSSVMRKYWPQIEGKCATGVAELEHAEKVATRMISVAAVREQSPARIAAATEMRVRAFTLFARAYDQVRRTVSFLRWNEGDYDAIAPSLYAGRGGRGKPAEEKPATGTTGTEVPPNPPGGPVIAPRSDLGAIQAKPAVGVPGSQPFLPE